MDSSQKTTRKWPVSTGGVTGLSLPKGWTGTCSWAGGWGDWDQNSWGLAGPQRGGDSAGMLSALGQGGELARMWPEVPG